MIKKEFEHKGFEANGRLGGEVIVTRISDGEYELSIYGTFTAEDMQDLINAIVSLQD